MKDQSISKKQFDSLFKRYVKNVGGVDDAAAIFGVSPTFVRSIMNDVDVPTKPICKKLGLKPVRDIKYRYEPLKEQ